MTSFLILSLKSTIATVIHVPTFVLSTVKRLIYRSCCCISLGICKPGEISPTFTSLILRFPFKILDPFYNTSKNIFRNITIGGRAVIGPKGGGRFILFIRWSTWYDSRQTRPPLNTLKQFLARYHSLTGVKQHSFNEDTTTFVIKQCKSLHLTSNTNGNHNQHLKKNNQIKLSLSSELNSMYSSHI